MELIHILQHGTNPERLQAAHLLAGYPEPQAVTALKQVINTASDPELQDMAMKSVGHLGHLALSTLIAALGDGQKVGHPRQAIRAAAAEALGKQQNVAAIEPLIIALKDASPDVRRQAAGALIHYKEDRTIEALKQVLIRDPDTQVRNRAASVLQAMGVTAPVNVPTIVTRPVTKPLPPLRKDSNSPKN